MILAEDGPMIGVVVWSNAEREKAVIWCEDQGALAYLHGRDNLLPDVPWPLAGDLVEMVSETLGDLRYARQVALVNRQHCVELPEILRQEAAQDERKLRLVASDGEPVRRRGRDSARDARELRIRRLAVCIG